MADTASKPKSARAEAPAAIPKMPRSGSVEETRLAKPKPGRAAEAPKTTSVADARSQALELGLRVALGFSGLALLVGFFLPWLRLRDGEAMKSGLELLGESTVAGTPPILLIAIPALGASLSAVAFMGFRWSGQVAVGVAVLLIGYALYVMLQLFVQNTGLGLWIVAGGTFIILLLGVLAWMTMRRPPRSPKRASVSEADDTIAEDESAEEA